MEYYFTTKLFSVKVTLSVSRTQINYFSPTPLTSQSSLFRLSMYVYIYFFFFMQCFNRGVFRGGGVHKFTEWGSSTRRTSPRQNSLKSGQFAAALSDMSIMLHICTHTYIF